MTIKQATSETGYYGGIYTHRYIKTLNLKQKKTMANVNENAQSAKSQCDMIAAWLERGYSITSLEALQRFGCMRLASRIHDLRERGMKINACKITTPTGKRVCEYVLAK